MSSATLSQIDSLEFRLADLAMSFRAAGTNEVERVAIAAQYATVFDEIIQVAGRFIEPHFDSLLPDGYMPLKYELRKALTKLRYQEPEKAESVESIGILSSLLSARESTILRQVAEGTTLAECARVLEISPQRVRNEQKRLFQLLAQNFLTLPAAVRDLVLIRSE